MNGEGRDAEQARASRRRLAIALWLNVGLAVVLLVAGEAARSSGLLANALDSGSDAAVYALSYFSVRAGRTWKINAARVAGTMLLVLSVIVLLDVARKAALGTEPVGVAMMLLTLGAAGVNVLCLRLLAGERKGEVNLRAAWTFSINDLLSNAGVLLAGLLVLWTGRSWPDLVIGLAIALVVGKGGVDILRDAGSANRGE